MCVPAMIAQLELLVESYKMSDIEKALDELEETSNAFTNAMNKIKDEQEAYWNSLSKEDQLKAFCAVSRRIFDGEIEQRGTYRYVLYNVFGFGPEAYVPAQCAGYLSIHNAIYTGIEVEEAIEKVARECIRICEEGEKTQTTSSGAASLIKQHFNIKDENNEA